MSSAVSLCLAVTCGWLPGIMMSSRTPVCAAVCAAACMCGEVSYFPQCCRRQAVGRGCFGQAGHQ